MFLSKVVSDQLSDLLKSVLGTKSFVRSIEAVSGGSINHCFKIGCGNAFFFLKVNDAVRFPGMFALEAEALRRIRATNSIAVPGIIFQGVLGDQQCLLLEWIEQGRGSLKSQQKLGQGLAKLHQHSGQYFGLDHDNYIGSLSQQNAKSFTSSNFFINSRLKPQLQLAENNQLISKSFLDKFEILFDRLGNLIPEEPPALIHGDLWAGNYVVNIEHQAFLIDPAISYSHREADIAMTKLFGGFDSAFYEAYQNEYPLNEGWRGRIDLWNLYPLLVHLNLFGLSYLSQVERFLNRYL